MAAREISIESEVILKHRQMIVNRIATSAGPLWLSHKLQQEDFISPERAAAILNTLGISSSDKVSQMMEAVESKIKYDPSQFFGKFVEIVESEPALEDVHQALNDYGDRNHVAQPPQDEDDDTDVDKNPKEQTLPANTDQNDKYGKSYQQLKTDGVVTIRNGKEKGQPFISCVCCSFPVAAVSVVAAMTAAFIALNYNDSDIDRYRHSTEYSEDRKALSTRTVFDFLWIISPPSVMFAVAITTYCTCSRTFLIRTHWFHFFNLMAICSSGILLMLLLLVWKPLKVIGYFLPLGMSLDDWMFFNTIHSSLFFVSAAVFVHPDKKCWLVMAIASSGVTLVFIFIYGYMAVSNDAPPTNLYQTLFFVIGTGPAVCVELWFMLRALSRTRIATLTAAKRNVLFFIILLLYTGYCICGIYEGLVEEAVVLAVIFSFIISAFYKVL